MNILSKIIFSIISLCILTLLIYITYITNAYFNSDKPFYEKINSGLFVLKENDDNSFSTEKVNEVSSGSIYIKKIDIFDNILFSNGNVDIIKNKGITTINITPGIYLFNFKNLNSNYTIKGDGFEVNNKGPGMFIINSLDVKKNVIFSLNSLIDLKLKNYKNGGYITNLDLYPHTYLVFNPIKNIFVKNSDLLKISQIFTLGYINEQIINENFSENFIDLISLKNDNSKEKIRNILLTIRQDYKEKIKIYNDFVNSSFTSLPGENFINKYSNLFINSSKKTVFYKNIIIRNLNKLLSSDELNPEIVNKIIINYSELKKINLESSKEIKNIINYYYSIVLLNNSDLNKKVNLYGLIKSLNKENISIDFVSLISLEKIFFEYDFLGNENIYKEISYFRKNYFNDLGINLKGENDKNINIDEVEKVDYLLFFMENILLGSDFSSSSIDTQDLINIFDDYVKIAKSFYIFNNDTIKRTGLYTNSQLLNKFIDIIELKYFNKERNKNGLLEKKEDEKINNEDIILLENNINELITFFEEQNTVLNPEQNTKDSFLFKLYENLKTKYKEYFSALKNYKEYLIKYDKSKNELLSTSSINENNGTITLSLNNATKYLSQFNGVSLSYMKVKIMDYNYCAYPSEENESLKVEIPYCYKIENILIDGKSISFLLHPFENNKIDEIYINNISKSGSYKLDEIQKVLDEKYKVAGKDKEKYNFKNYLVDTFGNRVIDDSQITQKEEEQEIIEEDTVVKIFKRNKLLGESGDFSILEGFLDIDYKNLEVTQKNNSEYSIYINGGVLNTDLGRGEVYYGTFYSDYNFSPNHSFINPKIKLIDKRNQRELIYGNTIDIVGEIKVNLFKENIKNILAHVKEIEYVSDRIYEYTNIKNTKISYINFSNKVNIDFIYKGKNTSIKLFNGNVTEFNYNNIKYINTPIKYMEVETILNKIK